jgi:glutamate synthase (NADPH/NADH) large chain
MSGGIAYVLDEIGDFEENRCNYQLVVTEKIEDEYDINTIKTLLEKHAAYTNSEKAKEILDNFDSYIDKFIRVISPAYKEVLAKRKQQQTKEVC